MALRPQWPRPCRCLQPAGKIPERPLQAAGRRQPRSHRQQHAAGRHLDDDRRLQGRHRPVVHGPRPGRFLAPETHPRLPAGHRSGGADHPGRASQGLRRPGCQRPPRRFPQHRQPYPAGGAGYRRRRRAGPVAARQPRAGGGGQPVPAVPPEQPAPGNLLQRTVEQGLVREL
ncbi:hypothetical protein FQZ97_993010 [compost metagenome]